MSINTWTTVIKFYRGCSLALTQLHQFTIISPWRHSCMKHKNLFWLCCSHNCWISSAESCAETTKEVCSACIFIKFIEFTLQFHERLLDVPARLPIKSHNISQQTLRFLHQCHEIFLCINLFLSLALPSVLVYSSRKEHVFSIYF
jgi:hypothetical protein